MVAEEIVGELDDAELAFAIVQQRGLVERIIVERCEHPVRFRQRGGQCVLTDDVTGADH